VGIVLQVPMERREFLLLAGAAATGAGLAGCTSAPRAGEQNGREYYFVPRAEFEEMVRRDEFLEYADVFGKLCDSASFRQSFADAEAKYRAARALVYSAWDALSERVTKGEKPNLEEIALIRLAMRHLHNVISDLSTFAHRAARGASLRPSQLQRCYRDIHAGTQHILLADEIMQECGKVLLGATGADARWTMFGVKG